MITQKRRTRQHPLPTLCTGLSESRAPEAGMAEGLQDTKPNGPSNGLRICEKFYISILLFADAVELILQILVKVL